MWRYCRLGVCSADVESALRGIAGKAYDVSRAKRRGECWRWCDSDCGNRRELGLRLLVVVCEGERASHKYVLAE